VSIDLSKNSAQARAFNPPNGDLIGMLDPVIIGNRPTGSTLKWEGDLEFLPGLGDGVRLAPRSGGIKTVRCSLVDQAGNVLTSASTTLSVPVLVSWFGMSLGHFLQHALDDIKLGDRRQEITTRIQAVVSELLPGMNLRIFPDDTPELVADMYRVDVSLVDKTTAHPYHLVTERYTNIAGTLGGTVGIGLSTFPDLPHAGPAFKAITDALKATASPSASLRKFTEEFLARIIGRITAYGVLKVLEPSAIIVKVASLEELTGYSLPAGVTASKKPSDYTDLGVTAMKLPDDWTRGVRKRLPIPPAFA
jgi:hypothetical protein